MKFGRRTTLNLPNKMLIIISHSAKRNIKWLAIVICLIQKLYVRKLKLNHQHRQHKRLLSEATLFVESCSHIHQDRYFDTLTSAATSNICGTFARSFENKILFRFLAFSILYLI